MALPRFSRAGLSPALALALAAALAPAFGAAGASAPTFAACASDGRRAPTLLLERFISADCEACWRDARTPRAGAQAVALDWIVPGSQGEDAPLAAAARRDGLQRLEALQRPTPAAEPLTVRQRVTPAGWRGALRVANGPVINDYLGASIEVKPRAGAAPDGGPWTAWLVLVESLPAGTEGSPVARHLVRNALAEPWDGGALQFTRSMQIPAGASPQRLSVVGWLQDAEGRVLQAAHSRCAP